MLPKSYPIFFIALAFAMGVVGYELLEITLLVSVSVAVGVLFLLGLFLWWAPKSWLRKASFIQGGLAFLLFVSLGFVRTYQVAPSNSPAHIIHWHDSLAVAYYTATAVTNLEVTPNSKRATLAIQKAFIDSQWVTVEGKLIAYFPKEDSTFRLSYGEELLIEGKPRLVPEPSNPHAFNYQAYLATNGITHQQFLRAESFVKTGNKNGNRFLATSWQVRSYFAAQFQQYIPNKESRAIALALILGVKDELDNKLKNAYAGAGAMHVLAVSGLHVGIILLILNYLFRPVAGFSKTKLVKGIVSLLVLWSYAFITGLSPSVMRAVTMFSIVVLGEMIRKKGNIYNTLSLSALILLLYNPYMLYQVGFQLSFAAVVGIVWLYPFFNSWFTFKWRIANRVWDITCVSLAAQVATFPIGLLYFHQFPNYFFLANLIVIPAAFLIVITGVSLLATSFFSPLASLIGYVLSLLIQSMNRAITLFNQLPFAVSENIYIDVFTAVCLSLMVVSLGKVFIQRKRKWLPTLLLTSIVFSSWVMYQDMSNRTRKTLAVYKTPRATNIAFLQHDTPSILVDSLLASDTSKLNYTFYEDLLFRGLPTDSLFRLAKDTHEVINTHHYSEKLWIFTWEGKSIAWLRGKSREKVSINVDYLVVSNNAIYHLEDAEGIGFTELIIDATNGYRTGENLLDKSKENGIKAHWVTKDGAWQVNL